ncbi:CheR family methyltransferase [Salegentibacter sp. F188]|uniref:CheR family methyltransferase n=1 Tax=Autumnicola patrickiae TaxID=3075591 RepID=A0ABU3E3M4_9FLAO|nr:CheR family methyltransferase [Salegentibacter sp. F188]MDT0689862.1 CheR family methyltransferase [Salegentibacter sp. F188]
MTKNGNILKQISKTHTPVENSRIIAVGASAGGLEALQDFFRNLSEGDNNTYIVIQHLSPDYKSMMGEILSKTAKLPIEQISDRMDILPGRIYLIPPVNNLVIENDKLHLLEKPKDQKLNLPIDIFLTSLSKFKKESAIAVILSGTGSDGTRGIRAIKEKNGMVMVQDPEEAKFNGMPQSAINTGLVDYVLPVQAMGSELANFINAPTVVNFSEDDFEYDGNSLSKILDLINQTTQLDFSEYKYSTLARRVARRVNVCRCNSLEEYYEVLTSNQEEVEFLYREFLIGVTKFFRDAKVWEIMEDEIIPDILSKKKDGDILKVWDVACSTGEEAYTLGMLISEELERQNKDVEVKIFATDIAEKHLEIGSKAVYPESVIADIAPRLVQKYLVSRTQGYQVVERIRRMVIFSKHNVIKNPPFSRMDLVLCRNLLIYFQPFIQKKALNVLHYGLKEDGYLVLGTSESVESHKEYFEDVSRKWKIYRNVNPRSRIQVETLRSSTAKVYKAKLKHNRKTNTSSGNNSKNKFINELNEAILEQFGGASVFIDSEYNILQAVGEFRKYANLPVNGFSINLLDMIGTDFKHILLSTVKEARKENKKTIYRDAIYNHQGETKSLDLIVKPFIKEQLDDDVNFVLTFVEKEVDHSKIKEVEKVTLSNRTERQIAELEDELKKTKEDLQHSLEEIERSNEELQSANEELLASNEELQSTNEELQSVNEEINTVNAENVQKMDDLAALNADMNNLLESTQIGTIFLDEELRIRKFTPSIKDHFSFLNSDTGRPIEHFVGHIGKANLLERCKRVLQSGKTLEKQIISKEGKPYLRRISAYRNTEGRISGVVITFIDIEMLEKSRGKLIASEKRFKSFYEEDPVMHFSIDPNTSEVVQCNAEAVEKLGYNSKDDLIGKAFFELYDTEYQVEALRLNKIFRKKGELKNVEQEMVTVSGQIIPIIMNATVEVDSEGKGVTHRFTCVDISELKRVQEELKEQKADLVRANRDLEQFVSICSHDLQEPLSTIKFGSDILGKIYASKLDDKGKEYLSYIDEASNRLANQIKALLDHSRIGRNTKKTLVNTKEVIEVVKYDLGKRIRDTRAKVHVGSLPKIKAYEVELRLLFQNLLSNALKYKAKDRDPEIRISSYQEGEYWVFAVMDNGIGISEEDQKGIFTIFNRIPTEEKYEGTGVGLAHVEKIVLLHEGTLWLDSQPGVGSTFYFKIKRR